MDYGLTDRVALVTGAANGIGAEVAGRLLDEGCHVIAVDREQVDLPSENASLLVPVICDLTDQRSSSLVMDVIDTEFGRLDVVVNNAAAVGAGTVLETNPGLLDQILRINLQVPFVLARAAVERMVQSGRGGSIVNVASINAIVGVRKTVSYSMAKAGLLALTRSIAIEHADDNVRCNAVVPGPVGTRLHDALSKHDRQARLQRIPMHRIADSREVADAVTFLASDRSSYVTGTTLAVDGGYLAYGTG